MPTSRPVVLTPTRAELGQRCHRRHVLSDLLDYRKYFSASAEFGSVLHVGAAEWWRYGSLASATIAMQAEYAKRFTPQRVPNPKDHTIELAEFMLRVYARDARLAGAFDGAFQLVQIEERIEQRLGDFRLSFQVDRLVYDKSRDLFVMPDLKTAARCDKRWAGQWTRSLQMKLYKYGLQRALHSDNVEVVIEGLEKGMPPRLVPVVAPTWTVSQLDEAVREFHRIATNDAALIQAATERDGSVNVELLEELALTSTAFNYNDCHAYNVECPFLPLCDADPSLRRGLLHAGEFFQIESEY